MKIDPWWTRLAAVHRERNGDLGMVWTAHDPQAGVTYIYDAALFQNLAPAVVLYGITARGRHIPIAWRKQDESLAERWLDEGLNTISEPVNDDQAEAEEWSRDLMQRIEAQTLRVEKRVGEWGKEYLAMKRQAKTDGASNRWEVPLEGFPLMSATRHAIRSLDWGQAEYYAHSKQANHPDIKVI